MASPKETQRLAGEAVNNAVFDGTVAGIVASAVTAAAHFALERFSPDYVRAKPQPKRIVAALFILGSFSLSAHLSQANHSTATNVRKMKEMEESDRALLSRR